MSWLSWIFTDIIIKKTTDAVTDLSDVSRNISPLRCSHSRRMHHRALTEAVTKSLNISAVLQHLPRNLPALRPDGTALKTPGAPRTSLYHTLKTQTSCSAALAKDAVRSLNNAKVHQKQSKMSILPQKSNEAFSIKFKLSVFHKIHTAKAQNFSLLSDLCVFGILNCIYSPTYSVHVLHFARFPNRT